jgi:glycosyltransferase involved in cell wall biosynthesis
VRIGLVSSLEEGGPVEHSHTLACGFARAGHEVSVVCATSAVAARFEAAGAQAHVVPLAHGIDLRGAREMRRCLRGSEIVHAQDRRSGLWIRVLPAASRPCVRVYTIHGLPEPYLPEPVGHARPGVRARLAYRALDSGLAWRADAIVTPSRAMQRELVRRLGWPPERITVIPNGVELFARPVVPGNAVGTLSSFTPVKGLDVFLTAASALAVRRPHLRFLLFGDGPEGKALRDRSEQLGLNGRAAFPGWVPSREALAELAVLVVASHMENAPLALLEAMAAGIPLVATRVGGIPEVAPPGTALLVGAGDASALAEAVEVLLDDDAAASAQIEAARRHVERHGSADVMVQRTLGLYERLLRARR